MAKEFKFIAEKRQKLGSAECRRMRRRGSVPGNIYGHGIDPVPIAVSDEVLRPMVMANVHVVDVEVDGKTEKAIFREVQWDTFGIGIQHFDLVRVSADERVVVDVPIELRGTAPGVSGGGMMEQPLHSIEIECLAHQIPDSIVARVGSLEIGQSIHVSDLQLPENATCNLPPDTVVAHVIKLAEAAEEVVVEGPAEPEVVGRKPEEGAEE